MGRTRRIELCRQNKMDAASRQLLFMSFKGIGKSIRMVRAPTQNADAPAHHSDQFPAGYSLTRCSPAALVSASPAGLDYAAALAQLRGLRGKITKEDCFKNENRLETAKQSTQGWVNDHENPWVNDCENPHSNEVPILFHFFCASAVRIDPGEGCSEASEAQTVRPLILTRAFANRL